MLHISYLFRWINAFSLVICSNPSFLDEVFYESGCLYVVLMKLQSNSLFFAFVHNHSHPFDEWKLILSNTLPELVRFHDNGMSNLFWNQIEGDLRSIHPIKILSVLVNYQIYQIVRWICFHVWSSTQKQSLWLFILLRKDVSFYDYVVNMIRVVLMNFSNLKKFWFLQHANKLVKHTKVLSWGLSIIFLLCLLRNTFTAALEHFGRTKDTHLPLHLSPTHLTRILYVIDHLAKKAPHVRFSWML